MSKITRIQGTLTLDVDGIPNREGTGKFNKKRLGILSSIAEDVPKGGENYVRARITDDGFSYTSSDCINQSMYSEYVPSTSTSDVGVDYSLFCSSVYFLLCGNLKLTGETTQGFGRQKSLKIGNAYDTKPHQVFNETKVNNGHNKEENGLRTVESAGKREQVSNIMIDIQNMSVFLMDGTAGNNVKHLDMSSPESIEKTLENLRKYFKSKGIVDVSNIASGKRVRLKTCVNGISIRGFVFTQEQVKVLIDEALELVQSIYKMTTHGEFKFSKLELTDQRGNKIVNAYEINASDIELKHEEIVDEPYLEEVLVKKAKKEAKEAKEGVKVAVEKKKKK